MLKGGLPKNKPKLVLAASEILRLTRFYVKEARVFYNLPQAAKKYCHELQTIPYARPSAVCR